MISRNRLENAIVMHQGSTTETIELYSYFSYENGQCGGIRSPMHIANIKRIGYFVNVDSESMFLNINIYFLFIEFIIKDKTSYTETRKSTLDKRNRSDRYFPSKWRNNFYGCTLNIGYKMWPPLVINVGDKLNYAGLEIDFLLIVCDLLNCTFNWIEYFGVENRFDMWTPLMVFFI